EPRAVLARHPSRELPVSLRGEILPALPIFDPHDASVPVRAFLAEVLDPLELPPNVTPSLAVGDAVRDHLPAEQLRQRHVPIAIDTVREVRRSLRELDPILPQPLSPVRSEER